MNWKQAVATIELCVLCGRHGTQVAHRNEGKGMGRKVADHLVAALCPACHHEIDNGSRLTRDERRALWDRAYVRTMDRLVRGGLVVVSAAAHRAIDPTGAG